MAESSDKVGCRFVSDEEYGTVRYMGQVHPTKGEWLGVEWDDPNRGKHDGSHNGQRYFNTSHPTSGSFIRPKKADFGVTFLESLADRYGRIEDENAGVIQEIMYVKGRGNQQTTVEVVGASSVNLKQSKLDQLREVVLRETLISEAGEEEAIRKKIPNTRELDVSRNLISSWTDVCNVTKQLVKLKSLNVSNNRLSIPSNPESLAETLKSVEVALLNRMDYNWTQVCECSRMLPCLVKLHACFNAITTLSCPLQNMSNILLLNLESNPLAGWAEVLKLGGLLRLETLILNETGLGEIEFPAVEPGHKTTDFPSLKSLSISRNNIAQWQSIDELNKFQRLERLRCKFTPLSNPMSEANFRHLVLPKIATLKMLNNTEVDLEERKGSEFDYLKRYGRDWRASGGHQDPAQNKPSAEFTRTHPVYQHLIDKCGPPEDSELKEHSSALKNSLIVVTIQCPSSLNKPPVSKKLPVSMTVQKLKVLLVRLFKVRVDPFDMKLTYTSNKMVDQEIDFESDMKEIGFYSIEDGDTIHVTW